MSTVLTHMTMSLDGFIADPKDGIDELFGWYGAGRSPSRRRSSSSSSTSTRPRPIC